MSIPLSFFICHDFSFFAPSIDFMKLVFPLPDVPMRKTNSPGSMMIDISRKMVRSPYAIVTLLNCIDY